MGQSLLKEWLSYMEVLLDAYLVKECPDPYRRKVTLKEAVFNTGQEADWRSSIFVRKVEPTNCSEEEFKHLYEGRPRHFCTTLSS